VEVEEDNVVRLEGKVRSLAELEEAEESII